MFGHLFSGSRSERAQLLADIEQWHREDEHQKIIDTIGQLPEADRGYDLTCLLARAFNNAASGSSQVAYYSRAEELLRSVEAEGLNDPLWHFRMGYALYYLDREEEALPYLRQAAALDPSDSDAPELIAQCEKYIARSKDIAPVTIERMQLFFDEGEYKYDYEGSTWIKTGFGRNSFSFAVPDDQTMAMWSAWAPNLPIEIRAELLDVCNEWHNDMRWPKTYVQVKDNGTLWVCCEHNVNTRNGCTTNQIFRNIGVFIQSSCEFFDRLEERFPQFADKEEDSEESLD